ncbi:MAG: glycosyltransferase 61 family protein [Lachnospiraceae bacterium]|nr:glycosyltransferase 61 family protein [Lachnospiraceae bacterium]
MSSNIEIRKDSLKIECYDYGYAVPGKQDITHIYDKAGNYVPFTYKRKYNKTEYAVPKIKMDIPLDNVEFIDEEVVYLGFMRGHWGHFMVDSSVRLWCIDTPECREKRMIMTIEGMNDFYKKLFSILGIEEKILFVKKPMQFKSIYVPEISYYPGHYITKEFLYPFNKVAENIKLKKPFYEKLYFSRVNFAKGKKEYGEKEIQRIFQENGYQVVYPEELTYEEQVWLLKNCKSLATTNGTIAHNILYACDCTELIILNRFNERENIHQKGINQLKKINVRYINAYVSGSNHDSSMLYLTKDLYEFFLEKKMKYHVSKMKIKTKKLLFKLYICLKSMNVKRTWMV